MRYFPQLAVLVCTLMLSTPGMAQLTPEPQPGTETDRSGTFNQPAPAQANPASAATPSLAPRPITNTVPQRGSEQLDDEERDPREDDLRDPRAGGRDARDPRAQQRAVDPRDGRSQTRRDQDPRSANQYEPFDTKESNEFQQFIRRSTGKTLPLFGYGLFNSATSTFAPVDRVPVTADYVVGPGDELVVRAWGGIDIDFRATVDRNGEFYIPRVGNVNLSGVRYQDLQARLKSAIGRTFRNFDLNVGMGQLRSIQVFVVGQARRPGAYTVSSLSTLVNTLFASGGPSGKGSMRRIQLKRDNRVVTEFDIYDMLIKGDKSKDVRVLPGDVIYIPAIGPLVAVAGSVNIPGIYEIKGKPTLEQAIEMAGGLATTAEAKKVMLERIDNRRSRTVEEFGFDRAGLARTLEDGDLVTVKAISPRFDNAVTLRGNVASAARYPWFSGMRLRDLIPEKEALITPDYWARKNASTLVLIQGNSKLRNDVKNSLAEVNWDYAVIERLNLSDLTTTLIPFNLGKVVLEGAAKDNLPLLAGDVVTVFSKDDIQVPVARQTKYVRLEGEISQSGLYKAEPGETLRQMAARVGALTPQAYLYGSEFTRESSRVAQQARMDEALEKMEREAERSAASRAQNAGSPEEVAGIKTEMEGRRLMYARMRTVKATGRIPLELSPQSGARDLPDLVLEDGDRFVIPARPSVVGVVGSVYNANTFLYKPNKRINDYLGQAGGMTKEADEKSAYVIKADGSVISRQQFGWLAGFGGQRLMPGDTIVVPEHANRTTWVKDFKDWTQILYNLGLGAAALQVLK
jgi:polysaccharide export outer membrane protein